MIGKIMKAASFSRCVHYVTGKEDARILASDGVLLTTTQDIIDSFEFQRQMNPRISKPVGHIALSFLPEDKDKLTDDMMTRIAQEYMELMGIKGTQFLLVRHFDNGNPHCHLVYNRINNEGKTISDQNDFRRNEQVTKLLKRKYGLTFSKGKGRTKTERLRGTEKTKYEIYRIVMNTLAQSTSWKEFMGHLREDGVEMELVMRRKDSRDPKDIQGICFIKDGYTFKASQIKRGMTFDKMDTVIKKNVHKAQQETIANQPQTRHYEQPKEELNSKQQERNEPSIGIPSLGLFDTSNPVYDPAEEEFRRRMQRKKKKRGPRL
ncbi:MAG: relaxase/mobilization nuclease domain-containing protein [Lachnospiraceae bacterium]|nr:relaxase/mobilization nuclease domain-containing protein [Lachnospiraceae bacterium]